MWHQSAEGRKRIAEKHSEFLFVHCDRSANQSSEGRTLLDTRHLTSRPLLFCVTISPGLPLLLAADGETLRLGGPRLLQTNVHRLLLLACCQIFSKKRIDEQTCAPAVPSYPRYSVDRSSRESRSHEAVEMTTS